MGRDRHRRVWVRLALLLALALAWPAAPLSAAGAPGAAMPDDEMPCTQCCLRCDDAGVAQVPCPGSAAGCLGLVAMTAPFALPAPAVAGTPYRIAAAVAFRTRIPGLDHPPPKRPQFA